ncbi:MAG: hypothetical protein LBQ60_15095, partial [Bacteroidales bacterium]|nr:hypothetical protein [Bacteroidales bacterium]
MKAQTCDDLTAKCKPTINVYLDANAGQGTLYPADINDGSSSSCTIDSYEISENGFFYGSAIGFLCNDIPTSPHTVYLRVTDAAGSEVCETQVTVLPLPPVISDVPADITVSCDNIPPVDQNAVTVTSGCTLQNDITITVSDSRTDGNCPNNYTITRTWTAVDKYNYQSSASQIITVEDKGDPVISNVPVNTTVSCNNVPAADVSTVTVTDNCSTSDKIIVTVNDVRTDGNCPNNYVITRTWTATDECGNSSTAVQVITVEDNVAPSISNVPVNTTVSCNNVPAADPSAVTVTDNCSALDKITVTVNDVRADGNCPNNYTITRT